MKHAAQVAGEVVIHSQKFFTPVSGLYDVGVVARTNRRRATSGAVRRVDLSKDGQGIGIQRCCNLRSAAGQVWTIRTRAYVAEVPASLGI